MRIRNSNEKDASLLAPNLRDADLEELEAASTLSPFEVLYAGYYLGSPCRTFVGEDGNIIAMYGITPMLATYDGIIWCLTSPELYKLKNAKFFMKHCSDQIEDMCSGYDKVYNYVYHKNASHIRWLKHMYFDMHSSPVPFGHKQEMFYYFEKVMK